MPRVKKTELARAAHVLKARKYAQWCAAAGISFPETELEAIAAYRGLIRLAEMIEGKPNKSMGSAQARPPFQGPDPTIGPQTATAP